MKRTICLLLCILMFSSLMALPVSAAIFQVSYYEEDIYAGGIMDLYAFPKDGGVEPFTYRWQAEGFGWIDLDDNESYKGTKTNHLQIYTKTGDYGDFSQIPFRCEVTDAEGTAFYTPSIYPDIYPTAKLIPNMRKWGYGLYEPTISNVTGLQTRDDANYTASTYAGNKLDIFCGSKPVEDKQVLSNSEVTLTRQIHITENGHTTQAGDRTTYIPYTIGNNAVTVEIKLNMTIGSHDLGTFDTKTIKLNVAKPTATSTATAKSDCSLLRYTYNESQKLASIPKGATVEVLSKEGSYYQVFYNNMVGYVGTSLLDAQTPSYDPVIKEVGLNVTAPVDGEKPSFTCQILTDNCQLYKTDPITWTDVQSGKFLTAKDTFQKGNKYTVTIWLAAKSGYKFQTDASYNPKVKAMINGNLPPFIYKAYEQDPEEVIELTYTFVAAEAPQQTHTCTPVLVERIEPTCTEPGREAYYRCACGMHYKDAAGTQSVNISTWGDIPATGHTASTWRTTQVYHYKVCTACGDMLEQEDHTGGTATCTQKANCSVCGYAYGREEPDHRWSPTWLYQDSTGHAWICADCKAHSKVEKHTPGPSATETTPQTCKDCGYILEPAKNHTHKLTKVAMVEPTCTQEGRISYYSCDGCSMLFEDKDGKIEIPDSRDMSLPALGHTLSDAWVYDEHVHWHNCTVCKNPDEETQGIHKMNNGKCSVCSYEEGTEPVLQPQQETKPAAAPPETEAPANTQPEESKPQGNDATKGNTQATVSPLAVVLIGVVSFIAAITATVIILKKSGGKP